MNIKNRLKRIFKVVFAKRPIYTKAYISQLAPNELLTNRCALITGGTSGIGYAIAKAFLDAGAYVIITGRNKERIDKTLNILDCPKKATGIVLNNCDVSSFDETFQNLIRNLQQIGFPQMDILVNNAGVNGAGLPDATEKEYDLVMDTDLKGTFFLSQLFGKYMRDNHIKGNILNIASSSSLRPANSAYTLAKWGIRGLTIGLAKILIPYGITVNGLAPGPTATPMMLKNENDNITHQSSPIGRFAMPEEIASMAVILTSNIGKTIVGDIVYMTSGSGIITYDDIQYNF